MGRLPVRLALTAAVALGALSGCVIAPDHYGRGYGYGGYSGYGYGGYGYRSAPYRYYGDGGYYSYGRGYGYRGEHRYGDDHRYRDDHRYGDDRGRGRAGRDERGGDGGRCHGHDCGEHERH